MTDKKWLEIFIKAIRDDKECGGHYILQAAIIAIRREEKKEAAERAVEWNEYHCGKMLDGGASCRAAILGDKEQI